MRKRLVRVKNSIPPIYLCFLYVKSKNKFFYIILVIFFKENTLKFQEKNYFLDLTYIKYNYIGDILFSNLTKCLLMVKKIYCKNNPIKMAYQNYNIPWTYVILNGLNLFYDILTMRKRLVRVENSISLIYLCFLYVKSKNKFFCYNMRIFKGKFLKI